MIKVFYIEDKNGQYVSADGSKRWTRLTGQALYDFLQTERGKKTYFFVDTDDNGVASTTDTMKSFCSTSRQVFVAES